MESNINCRYTYSIKKVLRLIFLMGKNEKPKIESSAMSLHVFTSSLKYWTELPVNRPAVWINNLLYTLSMIVPILQPRGWNLNLDSILESLSYYRQTSNIYRLQYTCTRLYSLGRNSKICRWNWVAKKGGGSHLTAKCAGSTKCFIPSNLHFRYGQIYLRCGFRG